MAHLLTITTPYGFTCQTFLITSFIVTSHLSSFLMDEPDYEQISADFTSLVVDTKKDTFKDSCLLLMISFMNGGPCPISSINLIPFTTHYSLYSILGWRTHLNLYCLTCQFVLVLHFSYMFFHWVKKSTPILHFTHIYPKLCLTYLASFKTLGSPANFK